MDLDVARYRRAAEQLAWESSLERGDPLTVRGVAYIGAVTAAMRTYHLTGGAGRTFTDALLETLTSDPLGLQAATELGPVNCLVNEKWVSAAWPQIEARVAEAPMQPVSAVERAHRRAAVEYALQEVTYKEAPSVAAIVASVDMIAAAKVRWIADEMDYVPDANPRDLINAVINAEPIAAAADAELDGGWKESSAKVITRYWDDMRDKASDLMTAELIGEAIEGPEQRVEAARRGARRFWAERVQDDPEVLAYVGAVAGGRARWLEQGADPELRTLFMEQEPDLHPSAELVDPRLRDLVRQGVDVWWDVIIGEPLAAG